MSIGRSCHVTARVWSLRTGTCGGASPRAAADRLRSLVGSTLTLPAQTRRGRSLRKAAPAKWRTDLPRSTAAFVSLQRDTAGAAAKTLVSATAHLGSAAVRCETGNPIVHTLHIREPQVLLALTRARARG